MTDNDPKLLRVGALTPLGAQFVLLGCAMFAIGIVIGIEYLAQPAMAEWAAMGSVGDVSYPDWLLRAEHIRNAGVVTAAVGFAGALYLDWIGGET